MRLILISDSHGNKAGIDKIFEQGDFDYLFFLGDGLADLKSYIDLPNVYAVSGNCDFLSPVENEKFVELEGKKILFTHGNVYGVKYGLDKLISRAKECDADFVFFGHTHKQLAQKIDKVYYINPGTFHKNSDKISVGLVLNIDGDKVNIETLKIE